jgi:TonB family protein
MLKRTLFLCSLASLAVGAAYADSDTKPVEIGRHECTLSHTSDPMKVDLGYTITAMGKVTDVRVLHSSGNTSADERFVDCVAGKTYTPATHNGVAVDYPTHTVIHWGRVEDLEGSQKAFAILERDADRRCHKLYPIDRRFMNPTRIISRITISRQDGGEMQFAVTQSAGEKQDSNAVRCLKEILNDHDDLPSTFARDFEVNWAHH